MLSSTTSSFTILHTTSAASSSLEAAHAAAKDVDAAGLLSKAAMRLRHARATSWSGNVSTCEPSCRCDFFASVLFFRLLQVAHREVAGRGRTVSTLPYVRVPINFQADFVAASAPLCPALGRPHWF